MNTIYDLPLRSAEDDSIDQLFDCLVREVKEARGLVNLATELHVDEKSTITANSFMSLISTLKQRLDFVVEELDYAVQEMKERPHATNHHWRHPLRAVG